MRNHLKKAFNINTLFFVCILLSAVAFGIKRIYTVDFVAINGDFQNYNVFRRLLDGQVPYVDFANYLGIGIILLNLPLMLFANSFAASLFVTNFSSCLIYTLAVTLIIYLVTKNKPFAYLMGALSPFFESIAYTLPFCSFLNTGFYLVHPGNSMRTTRAFLPFLIVGIFLVFQFFYRRRHGKGILVQEYITNTKFTFLLGLIIGALILWSNDFGFACVGSSAGLLILLSFFDRQHGWKTKCKSFGLFLLGALLGCFLCTLIVTRGRIDAFLEFTVGVAEYQFWYYGCKFNKILTIPDLLSNTLFNWLLIWFVVITAVFLYRLIKRKAKNRDILLMFLYYSTFLASLIYVYGSGHFAYEGFFLTTAIIIGSFVCAPAVSAAMKNIPQLFRRCCAIGLCAILLFNCSLVVQYTDRLDNEFASNYTYVEGLKGRTHFGESILKAKDYIGKEAVFSTYASALETVTEQFQPTGVDYIIHVLGDEQREKYLNDFLTGNYKFVSTIRGDYDRYEYWARRTNWFFYRELYRRYAPTFTTDYSILWEKTKQNHLIDTKAEIKISELDDATKRVIIRLPEYYDPAIADLKISYKSSWTKERFSQLAYKKVVSVWDGGDKYFTNDNNECYFIPPETEEYYIPMVIENGVGTLEISSYPLNCTSLDDLTVEVVGLIDFDKVTIPWVEYQKNSPY